MQIKGGASDGFPHIQTYKNHLNKKPLTNDVYLPNEARSFHGFMYYLLSNATREKIELKFLSFSEVYFESYS